MLSYKWVVCLALISAALILVACQPVMPVAPASTDTPLPAAQTPIAVSNQALIVDAGAEQTITLPGVALLEGTVLDDHLPDPPGAVTTTWSVIDGTGIVTFTNAAALDTAVSFSAPGVYTLALTAGDGEFTASDQLTVTVNEVEGMSIIHVPGDAPTVQAGIAMANDGDLVLVAPGEYYEPTISVVKSVVLASWFYTTGDPSYVDGTVLVGAVYVGGTVGSEATITGFTIRSWYDGISVDRARINILYNRFTGSGDGIEYYSGGGLCRKNMFDGNMDDAIDIEGATEVIIEDNILANSGDDGIQIRFHPYTGPALNVVIRRNLIASSGQNGIQLIGHDVPTDRVFVIEHNVIRDSEKVGLGLMDQGLEREDFRGASLPERIHLYNNTFIDNAYGVTGGDNLIALNNIFAGSSSMALKNVDGDSIAAYNLFWGNVEDQVDSNVDTATSVFADPILDADARLLPGSPAIDAGTALLPWDSETVLDLQPDEYRGTAPDMGAYETQGGND